MDDVIWQWQQWPEMYGKCSESICLYLTRKGFVLKLKGKVYTMHQVWQCEELLDVWQRDLANKCRTWKRECSMLDEHDQMDVWFTLKERKKNAEMGSEPVSLVIKKGWLKWFGYVEQQWKTWEVEGSKPRRHLGRQRWDDVSEDMKRFGLSWENAQSWRKWRRKTEAVFG